MPLPINLPQYPEVVNNPAFELHLSSYVKDAMVDILRLAFSSSFIPQAYRLEGVAVPNDGILRPGGPQTRKEVRSSQINIHKAFPGREVMHPSIIVETGDADVSVTTLDNEQLYEVYDDNGTTVGRVISGTIWIPVELSIEATTIEDRDTITDLCSIMCRTVFREKFRSADISFLEVTTSKGGEREAMGEMIFDSSVNLRCQQQFKSFMNYDLFAKVNSYQFKPLFSVGE